jgi:hypothetical protein
MTNWIALDVAIGLILVFLLYSLLATVIQELLATLFGFRAKILERAICRMLQDASMENGKISRIQSMFKGSGMLGNEDSLLARFYKHPLIQFLGESDKKKPSYITSKNFSSVLVDLITENTDENDLKTRLNRALDSETDRIGNKTLALLRKFWREAEDDLSAFQLKLEQWFDETQIRCTGWYKKNTQFFLLIIGFIIAVFFNIDSIAIAGKLQKDPKLREAVVAQASDFVKSHPDLIVKREEDLKKANAAVFRDSTQKDSVIREIDYQYKALIAKGIHLQKEADSLISTDLAKVNGVLGLGLKNVREYHEPFFKNATTFDFCQFCKGLRSWGLTMVGWIIAALAISLGAPFWFDLLNKIMQFKTSLREDFREK